MNPGGVGPGGMDLYGHFAQAPRAELACPHCRGISQIVPNDELHFVCSICGGPRIRLPEGVPPSPALDATLKKADAARKSRGFMRGLSIAGGLGAAFGGLLFVLATLIGGFGWGVALGAIFGAPFLAALVVGLSRSGAKNAELQKMLDAAWAVAAAEVVRAGKGATANDLANALGIDLVRAEQLHAMQSIDAVLAPGADDRVRVAVPPDPRFEALEQRARIADQRAEQEAAAEAEAEADAAHPTGAAARATPKSS